jgi:hypothetical protein
MKNPVSSGRKSNLAFEMQGTETEMSLDLQLALTERKAHELWKRKALEQEGRAVRAEQQLLATQALLAERETGLEMIQRIAEAGGLLVSDREDLLATYRR